MSDENSRRNGKLFVFFIVIFNALIILILSSVTMPIATNKRNLKDSRVWPIYFLKKKCLLYLTSVYKEISIQSWYAVIIRPAVPNYNNKNYRQPNYSL